MKFEINGIRKLFFFAVTGINILFLFSCIQSVPTPVVTNESSKVGSESSKLDNVSTTALKKEESGNNYSKDIGRKL